MTGRRGEGWEADPRAGRVPVSARSRRRPVAGRPPRPLLVALLALALAVPVAATVPPPGPSGTAQAQSAVSPSTPADRAKAEELRKVARDALAGRPADDDDVDLDGSLLGIGGVVWRILAVVLVAVAVLIGIALYRRGPRRRRRGGPAAAVDGDETAELERQALRAEEAGEHRAAVVLWFRVGARRLAERLRLRAVGAATASQIARESGDPRVGALAVEHDRAAYGPGPVGADASRGAREGWRAVLREPVAAGDRPTGGARSGDGSSAGDDAGPAGDGPAVGRPPRGGGAS